MIAVVGAVILALFLFAKPFGNAILECIKALVRFLLSLLNRGREDVDDDNELAENTSDVIDYTTNENPYADLLMFLLAAGIVPCREVPQADMGLYPGDIRAAVQGAGQGGTRAVFRRGVVIRGREVRFQKLRQNRARAAEKRTHARPSTETHQQTR